MPTLDWIGKKAVVNHHHQVPYHLLRDVPDLSVGDPGTGNLIVEGDNLLALKALLPYYAGQVKCIYIAPPYNTGNEGWVYNPRAESEADGTKHRQSNIKRLTSCVHIEYGVPGMLQSEGKRKICQASR